MLRVAGVFVTFPRGPSGPGALGDRAWTGAALVAGGRLVAGTVLPGRAGAPYAAGLLALREGELLERAITTLGGTPDLVLVDATGLDHPRGAGLALHLGAVLGVPTIGVTDRPLMARGPDPGPLVGAVADLLLDGQLVGMRVRTAAAARPVVVHAAWRTEPQTAAAIVLGLARGVRTPLPLREARRLARAAREAT
jgi:deoxyribonuclease V